MIVKGKNDNKVAKNKKDIIISYLEASIDSIFIDEAQDLDIDALMIFVELGNNIFIHMVGDPKQAIKAPNSFKNISEGITTPKGTFILLDNNNVTRRIPKKHLAISNLLCSEDEKQQTISKVKGSICYLYSEDDVFGKIYSNYKENKALIYCEKKSGDFCTNVITNRFQLEESVVAKILEQADSRYDADAFIGAITELFVKNRTKYGTKEAIKMMCENLKIQLESSEYAKIEQDLNVDKENAKYQVISIDKAKGLENERCMFIMNNSMLDYLFNPVKEFNKEKMYLYIALTRSKRDLILVVDEKSIFGKKDRKFIDKKFKELDIIKRLK